MKKVSANVFLIPNEAPGMWFNIDYHCVLYKGCQEKCIYCASNYDFIQENDEYLYAKIDSASVLNTELSRVSPSLIGLGSMCESYNIEEKELMLTRKALEQVSLTGNSVHITTKSELILRDVDILSDISFSGVAITIICDDRLSYILEPGLPSSEKRFKIIQELSKAGIYTGVLLMPVIPFLTDTTRSLSEIIEKSYDAGAKYIIPYFGINLPEGIRKFFFSALEYYFPGYSKLYYEFYGEINDCRVPRYEFLKEFFIEKCKERGLEYNMLKLQNFKK